MGSGATATRTLRELLEGVFGSTASGDAVAEQSACRSALQVRCRCADSPAPDIENPTSLRGFISMETPAEPPYHFNPIDVLVEDALGWVSWGYRLVAGIKKPRH